MLSGRSSVGRASAFQAECREFEPRRPLFLMLVYLNIHLCTVIQEGKTISSRGETR